MTHWFSWQHAQSTISEYSGARLTTLPSVVNESVLAQVLSQVIFRVAGVYGVLGDVPVTVFLLRGRTWISSARLGWYSAGTYPSRYEAKLTSAASTAWTSISSCTLGLRVLPDFFSFLLCHYRWQYHNLSPNYSWIIFLIKSMSETSLLQSPQICLICPSEVFVYSQRSAVQNPRPLHHSSTYMFLEYCTLFLLSKSLAGACEYSEQSLWLWLAHTHLCLQIPVHARFTW